MGGISVGEIPVIAAEIVNLWRPFRSLAVAAQRACSYWAAAGSPHAGRSRGLGSEKRHVMIERSERGAVRYEVVAGACRVLEQAGGRLTLIVRLAALLARTPAALLPTV